MLDSQLFLILERTSLYDRILNTVPLSAGQVQYIDHLRPTAPAESLTKCITWLGKLKNKYVILVFFVIKLGTILLVIRQIL